MGVNMGTQDNIEKVSNVERSVTDITNDGSRYTVIAGGETFTSRWIVN